jgi:hypothetical protein
MEDVITRITDLEKSFLDHNETVQKIDKRIWSIAARLHGRRDDGTFDKIAIGAAQKQAKRGKSDNPVLMLLTAELVQARNLLEARQEEVKGRLYWV